MLIRKEKNYYFKFKSYPVSNKDGFIHKSAGSSATAAGPIISLFYDLPLYHNSHAFSQKKMQAIFCRIILFPKNVIKRTAHWFKNSPKCYELLRIWVDYDIWPMEVYVTTYLTWVWTIFKPTYNLKHYNANNFGTQVNFFEGIFHFM